MPDEPAAPTAADPTTADVRRDDRRLPTTEVTHEVVDRLFREEQGRAVATLIRVLGDFDLAEEAVQEAFVDGARDVAGARRPGQPGRLDHDHRPEPGDRPAAPAASGSPRSEELLARGRDRVEAAAIEPAMQHDRGRDEPDPGRPAAADLHLLPPGAADGRPGGADPADARRARRRPRSPGPSSSRSRPWPSGSSGPSARSATPGSRTACRRPSSLPERLDGVLRVLYLVFNEGYAATSGDALIRRELCAEAIRLARVVVALLPDEPEAAGLLALMLLHDARRDARVRTAASWSCSTTRTARAGTARPDRGGPRAASTGRSLRRPPGAVPGPGGDRGPPRRGGHAGRHGLAEIAALYRTL